MEKFVYIDGERDIAAENARCVVLEESAVNPKYVENMKKQGLLVWVRKACAEEIPVKVMQEMAGRVQNAKGILRAATCRSFGKMLESMGESLQYIDGFILPSPELSEALWRKEFDKFFVERELFEIFDQDVKNSRVRIFYYEAVERYLVTNYIEPVYAMAEEAGKQISFDMGDGEIQYDFTLGINPIRLACKGISVTFCKASIENEAVCRLCRENCFIIETNELIKANTSEGFGKVLLIKPVRGCRARYVYSSKKHNVRLETPALEASMEGTYYCDMLTERNMDFLAVDEYIFENLACISNGKITLFSQEFEDVIVCEGCMFEKMFGNVLGIAEKSGISVNSAELLKKLSAENWEEI